MTVEKIEQIKEMHKSGKSIATISKELVISRSSVYYVVDPIKKEQAKKQALANYYKNKEHRRETQKTYYEKTREDLRDLFATTGTRFPMLEGLRLLQVCDGSYTLYEDTCESGKMDFVISDLKNKKDQKACIWFRYLPGVPIIKEKLGDKCVIVTGDTKPELKKYAKWAFNGVNNNKDKEEFYRIKEKFKLTLDLQEAQYYSSTYSLRNGMGLDLDESRLNYFMSYDHSPASLSQARARIIRLSQTDDCESLFLVCRDTLEPQSLSAIIRKMERQHELLDGIQSAEYDLNRELREILMKEINR